MNIYINHQQSRLRVCRKWLTRLVQSDSAIRKRSAPWLADRSKYLRNANVGNWHIVQSMTWPRSPADLRESGERKQHYRELQTLTAATGSLITRPDSERNVFSLLFIRFSSSSFFKIFYRISTANDAPLRLIDSLSQTRELPWNM